MKTGVKVKNETHTQKNPVDERHGKWKGSFIAA